MIKKIVKYKTLEELPMREYIMYALGAAHAENFEHFTNRFKEIFLLQSEVESKIQKEDKGQDCE